MSVYKKIHQVQKNRLQVVKNCKANLGGGRVYEYASLDDVLAEAIPALSDAGLVLVQSVVAMDNTQFVRTEIVDPETGEKVVSDIAMPPANKWHDFGSGMTYARRYSLSALLGIACDADDDANTAMDSQRKPEAPRKPEQPKELSVYPILQKFIAEARDAGFEMAEVTAVDAIWNAAAERFELKCDPSASMQDKGLELKGLLNKIGASQFAGLLSKAHHLV